MYWLRKGVQGAHAYLRLIAWCSGFHLPSLTEPVLARDLGLRVMYPYFPGQGGVPGRGRTAIDIIYFSTARTFKGFQI